MTTKGLASQLDDLDLVAPEVLLEQELTKQHEAILNGSIQWEAYKAANLLTDRDVALLRNIEKKADGKKAIFEKDGAEYAELLIRILNSISNQDAQKHALTLVYDLLQGDDRRIASFFFQLPSNLDAVSTYQKILHAPSDIYVVQRATRTLAILLVSTTPLVEPARFFIRWLAEQLKKTSLEEILIAVSALMTLLRKDQYRVLFQQEDGLNLLAGLLKTQRSSLQCLYLTIYSLWLLTYNNDIAVAVSETQIIPRVGDILKTVYKEKIQRISLAFLRNVSTKGKNNSIMIENGIIKVLDNFSLKKWGDDDIVEDVEFLRETLSRDFVALSSWDEYRKELASSALEWTPVHRSEKFWRENIDRFEENGFQALKHLLNLLAYSSDSRTLAVALNDIGEFSRFHPRGRAILHDTKNMNAKVTIMTLMTHTDPQVQKEALLCVQKLMVHNWEYLSR